MLGFVAGGNGISININYSIFHCIYIYTYCIYIYISFILCIYIYIDLLYTVYINIVAYSTIHLKATALNCPIDQGITPNGAVIRWKFPVGICSPESCKRHSENPSEFHDVKYFPR